MNALSALLILCAVLPGFAQAPTLPGPDTLAARVDTLFSAWSRPDAPGAVCAVMQEGRLILARGYGMADLDHAVPLTPTSVFHVASLSKQFTAAAIGLLVQEGRLSLDDDLRQYLPELPSFGQPILIRHLLYHTSGLRDYHQLMGLTGWHSTDPLTNQQVVELLCRQRELNFPPGTEHLYSNSGYLLLAQVVQRASGQTLGAFAEERLFRPLGMAHTHFEEDHRQVVPQRVISYEPRMGGGYSQLLKIADTCGDMGLLTTAEDLFLWDRNFSTGQVGGPALLDLMRRRGVLASGDTLPYAFGLIVGKYRGLETVDHSGSQQGFRTELVHFPQQHLTVAVLANLSTIDATGLAYQVADLYLTGRFPQPSGNGAGTGDPAVIAVDTLLLDAYAGDYQLPGPPGTSFTFTREGRRFFAQVGGTPKVEILPCADSVFFRPDGGETRAIFHRTPDGSISGFTLHQQGDQLVPRVQLQMPTPRELAQYAGAFICPELGTSYELCVEADSLVVKQRGQRTGSALVPRGNDQFDADQGTSVVFVRDEHHQITGLRYTSDRIRNLRLERQP
ncbi:MAG: serine hydrolase [Candidatus Latescibacteria bacterium]|nr:serine hydrolase [Candidatus Latescibacterota bacterium]